MTRACHSAAWRIPGSAALCMALLAGCAQLQDDPGARATATTAEQVHGPQGLALPAGAWPTDTWWTRYGDPALDALITQALDDAPGMRAVAARTRQASDGVARVRALTGLKTLGVAELNRQWSKTTGDVDGISLDTTIPGIPALSTPVTSTSGAAGIIGLYRFDLWGAEKAAVDAALGAKQAQQAEAAAARLALSGAIAQAWFQRQTTRRKIALLEQIRTIQDDAVAGAAARKARGLVTDTALVPSRQQVLASEQLLVAARAGLQAANATLRALAGLPADAPLAAPVASGLPHVTATLPADLPYQLLSRRPDLVALQAGIRTGYDQVAIAKAAFYPQFNLMAFLGVGTLHLRDLHLTRRQFNLIPGVTLPIFNLGALRAGLRSARNTSDALVEQYNQAVLNAVRDVTIAASALQAAGAQQRIEHEKVAQLRIPAADAAARHARGLASKVQADSARLPALQEELLLVDAQGSTIAADITLTAALGGGYQRAAPPTPEDAELATKPQ